MVNRIGSRGWARVEAHRHAELPPEVSGAISTAEGRVAWVAWSPNLPTSAQITIASASDGVVSETLAREQLWSVQLSGDTVAFIAPNADNDGFDDVWIHPLAP